MKARQMHENLTLRRFILFISYNTLELLHECNLDHRVDAKVMPIIIYISIYISEGTKNGFVYQLAHLRLSAF